MSKKSKGLILASAPSYGVGVSEDVKARLKHQNLMQDYVELQKEADIMKSKLDEAKQRKLMLAAEVRFLRRRYKYLVQTKNMTASQEQPNFAHVPNLLKQTKFAKENRLIKKAAGKQRLPLIQEPNPKKLKHSIIKQVEASPGTDKIRKKVSYSGKGITTHVRKDAFAPNIPPIVDKNHKEKMNDATTRNSIAAFDLNQESCQVGREASLPSRPPIFDLNEISTGDEDFQSNVEFEDAKNTLIRGINDDQQNDLKLSICRNAGEGSSRVGKRKISWQDPVALRV